jgi:indolepyruvate ferredoxin oxidoreductase beta subunit
MNAVSRQRPITIAVLAIGGQGGGVLTDWLIALAEHNGWYAQATSVAGVAQRTGATIYYLEMIPAAPGRTPVLAMMPAPGDVDIVIAAELMEAGRAIQRGLVTPDRTTLIASSHRALGILEKIAPGDGIADSAKVTAIAPARAQRFIAHGQQPRAEAKCSVN